MSRKKAALILDPDRRPEQMAYVAERAEILHQFGDQLWVSITGEQVSRFAERGIGVQIREEADWIELPAIVFDPAGGEPEPPSGYEAAEPPANERAYYLVQFIAPVDPAWVREITNVGGTFVQNVPVNAGVFRLGAGEASTVKGLRYVRWVGLYHPAYALSPSLAGLTGSFTAVSLRNLAIDPGSLPAPGGGNIGVRLFDDLDPDEVRPSLEAAGVTIVAGTGYGFVVDSDVPELSALLRVPGIFSVEINHPVAPANDRAAAITGVEEARKFGNVDFLTNLDGTGEIAGVWDNGLDTGAMPGIHPDLASRILLINNIAKPGDPVPDVRTLAEDPKDPKTYWREWHGTHVCGTIAGDGTKSGGKIRGVAPGCHLVFHGPLPQGFVLEEVLLQAHHAGARVHNNSWGTVDTVTNNRYMPKISDVIDRFCFTHPESLVLFSAGNEEQDVEPAPNGDGVLDMNRLPQHAVAKNILAVGAVESRRSGDGYKDDYRTHYQKSRPPRYDHQDLAPLASGPAGAYTMSNDPDQVALFSNRGPVNTRTPGGQIVAMGRVKPDLVAPGTNILSLRSSLVGPPAPSVGPSAGWMDPRPATCDPHFYGLLHGTSQATPHVSGAAILARQYYRARFGQLRRPALLEQVPSIVDLPSIAPHRDGYVVAWVRRDTASGRNDIVAATYGRDWVRRGSIVTLRSAVGDRPAPMLARHGNNTLLLHRASDGTIRLSLYNAKLAPINAFGSGGTVTLASASRPEDFRRPALCVHDDELAVVWHQSGADALLFRRFRAGDGAPVDGAPVNLGDATGSSSHPFIVHDGARYAVVWTHQGGTDHELRIRLVDSSDTAAGTQPRTLVTQGQEIRDPHLVWDPRRNRFLVVWVSSDTHPGGDIRYLFVDRGGNATGAANTTSAVPAANAVRRPCIALHPDRGYALLWEDNTRDGSYDVYLAFLDDAGRPDRIPPDPADPPVPSPVPRLARRLLRISDSPADTSGFATLVDANGVAAVWQGKDGTAPDRLGVYALNITPLGTFKAKADPNTPLIDSGRYTNHVLLSHNQTSLTSVSMAWAGGDYYMLRRGPASVRDRLEVVKTNADGLLDATYGANGARALGTGRFFRRHQMRWTGDLLICASVGTLPGPHIFLLDPLGKPVPAFGSRGTLRIDQRSTVSAAISPQLGHYTSPAFGIVIAYGAGKPPLYKIRYAELDGKGKVLTGPSDLASAKGTAPHGWFHFVEREDRSIAAWHREAGNVTTVFVNLFDRRLGKQHGPDGLRITGLPGESMNAVIAPRPVAIDSSRREYGVAWQYRSDGTHPWEIRFSRLNPTGQPMLDPPSPAPQVPGGTRDARVIFPGSPDWPPETDATAPQLVSTYTHQAWTDPPTPPLPAGKALPKWSPSYGLAWLGKPSAGGPRTLYFTVLDENGRRAQLLLSPPYLPAVPRTQTVPIVAVSEAGADVEDYELIWNGRTFRLTWTETRGGRLRHMQTTLTRQGGRIIYEEPSSALLRATLINGATNLDKTALPNIPTPPITPANRNHGYGWGRLNLRQSLAPSSPVTFHVRDDNTIGPGRQARYRFYLPPGTRLLRVTLAWTDPPYTGPRVLNNLDLRITPPGGAAARREYHGNVWQAPPNSHLSELRPKTSRFDANHNIEQVVVQDPPGGNYEVEVMAGPYGTHPLNQLNVQPYALVFVGSGPEVRFGGAQAPSQVPIH